MSTDPDNEEKLRQWLAALNTLQEVVNDLKVALAQVLSKEFNAGLLTRIEAFQTQLLDHDAAIAVLRHELSDHTGHIKAGWIDPAHLPQADPTKDVELMRGKIGKLKEQLKQYTAAFT